MSVRHRVGRLFRRSHREGKHRHPQWIAYPIFDTHGNLMHLRRIDCRIESIAPHIPILPRGICTPIAPAYKRISWIGNCLHGRRIATLYHVLLRLPHNLPSIRTYVGNCVRIRKNRSNLNIARCFSIGAQVTSYPITPSRKMVARFGNCLYHTPILAERNYLMRLSFYRSTLRMGIGKRTFLGKNSLHCHISYNRSLVAWIVCTPIAPLHEMVSQACLRKHRFAIRTMQHNLIHRPSL